MNDTPLRRRLGLEQDSATEDNRSLPQTLDHNQHSQPMDYTPSRQVEWDQIASSAPSNIPTATVRKAVKELLETAIYILLVFVIVRSMIQNFRIEGSSMEPSLHSGQYILVNKLVYFHFDINAPLRLLPGYHDLPERSIYPMNIPQRGEVVVFEYPGDRTKDYIKRVIALPGETIEIRDGRVFIDNEPLDEDYLSEGEFTYCNVGSECNRGPVTVPPGSIFVMGDNRSNSSDSREWDSLELDHVIGQAWVLYYPLDDLGVVPSPSYADDQ
jgi:signal peptidase I